MADTEEMKANITRSYVERLTTPGDYLSTPAELTARLIETGVPKACVWGAFNDAAAIFTEEQRMANGVTDD